MATYDNKNLRDLRIDSRYQVFRITEDSDFGICFILVDTNQNFVLEDKKVIAQVYLSPGLDDSSLEVKRVATCSECQGEGVMSFLLCAALQWAEDSGFTSVQVNPKDDDWLTSFYKKFRIADNPVKLI